MPGRFSIAAGEMGVRTAHQQEARAQLVVHVHGSEGAADGSDSGEEAAVLDAALDASALAADLKVCGIQRCAGLKSSEPSPLSRR